MELTTESAALRSKLRLVCKVESESLSPNLALVSTKGSESNLSPSWMVFWLLVKLLFMCSCWVVCSVEGYKSSLGGEECVSLRSLWISSVSEEGEARLVRSGTDTPGPRLSRLRGMDILESTDRMLDLENSPLWGLSPSEGCVLLVGVPTDPLIVQRSVGENSGSLIGPLGTNGVKIVEGDCSIPRLWRYNGIRSSMLSSRGLGTGGGVDSLDVQ